MSNKCDDGCKLILFVTIATTILGHVIAQLFIWFADNINLCSCQIKPFSTFIYVLIGIALMVYAVCVAVAVKVYNDKLDKLDK